MDHGANIGLVHADAECRRSHNAVEAVAHPFVDDAFALGAARFAVEAGKSPVAGRTQLLEPLAGVVARGGIEDEWTRDMAQQFQ